MENLKFALFCFSNVNVLNKYKTTTITMKVSETEKKNLRVGAYKYEGICLISDA